MDETSPQEILTVVCANVVKSLVDDTEAVEVKAVGVGRTLVLEIRAATGDVGKVVGRRGRTIQAIRTIMTAAGARKGLGVQVEVAE